MPHGWGSPRGRVLARAGIGILTWVIPAGLVDEAVGDGLAWEMRLRSLPSRLGVYFVLGCALLSAKPYPHVIREVTGGLERALAGVGWQAPATTALTAVRRRVGEKPLESVFRRLCSALSPGRAAWSHLGGLLLVAVDGTTVEVADTAENAAAFGRPGAAAGGKPASPAIRLVILIACGTRGLLGAASGPVRGKGTGEQALAGQLLGHLRKGMLVLADRGFYSWALPDGSALAHVSDPAAVRARNRRNGQRRRRGSTLPPQTGPLPGMTVRVIEFRLEVTAGDGTVRTGQYRLITTLADWRAFPAADLAAAYARRWAAETGFRELKTILRGHGRPLRGRTPALARQELWAYLAVYQALRTLITRAAARDSTDPAQISFATARNAAERTLGTSPAALAGALAAAETEMLRTPVPPREGRIWPRAKKTRPASRPQRDRPAPLARHATCTVTITPPGRPPENTTGQPKHPAHPVNGPP